MLRTAASLSLTEARAVSLNDVVLLNTPRSSFCCTACAKLPLTVAGRASVVALIAGMESCLRGEGASPSGDADLARSDAMSLEFMRKLDCIPWDSDTEGSDGCMAAAAWLLDLLLCFAAVGWSPCSDTDSLACDTWPNTFFYELKLSALLYMTVQQGMAEAMMRPDAGVT